MPEQARCAVQRRTVRCAALLVAGAITVTLLGGCGAPSEPGAMPTVTPVPSATPTATPAPSATPSPLPSPTATATATPAPTALPLQAEVWMSAASVAQGRTMQVQVACNQPCTVAARWGERDIQFLAFRPEAAWAAIAAHALAEPGSTPLRVTATTADGQSVSLASPLAIVAGEFESERLEFDEQTQTLLDPAISDAENARMNEVFAAFSPEQRWAGPFAWPWEGVLTSLFGTRRTYQDTVQSFHTGLDIDGETGDPIIACADGTVVLAETLQVRGNTVVLDHGASIMSAYYHLDHIDVAPGQTVHTGEQLGLMGSTGLSTGSHLHWEVRVGGIAVDPRQWQEQDIAPSMEGATS